MIQVKWLIKQMENYFPSPTKLPEADPAQQDINKARIFISIPLLKGFLDRPPTTKEVAYVSDLEPTTVRHNIKYGSTEGFGRVEKKPASEEGWYRVKRKEVGGMELPVLRKQEWGKRLKVRGDTLAKGRPDNLLILKPPPSSQIKEKLVKYVATCVSSDEELAKKLRRNQEKKKKGKNEELLNPELFNPVESISAYRWIKYYSELGSLTWVFDLLNDLIDRAGDLPDANDIGSCSKDEISVKDEMSAALRFSKIPGEEKNEVIGLVFSRWQENFGRKEFQEKYSSPNSLSSTKVFDSIGEQVHEVIREFDQEEGLEKYLSQ